VLLVEVLDIGKCAELILQGNTELRPVELGTILEMELGHDGSSILVFPY
jgi:hypothetical protein